MTVLPRCGLTPRLACTRAALGGRLTVRSSEASGTRFTAVIPVLVHVPGCSTSKSDGTLGAPRTHMRDSMPRLPRHPSSENCLLDEATRARLELEKFGADDGLLPFLPKDAPLSQSFEELKLAGQLPHMFDLVRERACMLVCSRWRVVHPCCATDPHDRRAAAGQLHGGLHRRQPRVVHARVARLHEDHAL